MIYTIAPSPLEADTLWAGTDDGYIWVTHDDGKHWTNVTPKGVTAWSKIIMMDASHFDPGTAYAAVDRHRLNDYAPHMYRTRDGGKTWREVDNGLPRNAYVQAIKQDPGRKGMLWAGTSVGVYVSFDGGDHWQSLRLNMPVVEIRDFAFHDNSVAIATFGRGLWVLDDLNPLHQLDPKVAASPAHLFKPEPAALQMGRGGFSLGTDLAAAPDMDPVQLWSGEPRMKGAIIDYYLKSNANGGVKLDILDSRGQVIRHYSSADKHPAPNPKNLPYPAVWRAPPASLPATAGMHRFTWDLRAIPPGTPKPTGMAAFFGGGGHEALAGQYTVRLTVDGQSYSEPLTLKPPVVSKVLRPVQYSAANKQAQVELLGHIEGLQSRVTAAERAAAQLRKELASLGKRASGSLADSIKSLDKKTLAIQGYAASPAPETSGEGAAQPTYDSLKGLASTLQAEAFALQQGGMTPPKQALITGFNKTSKTAESTLAAWEKLKTQDVEQLNAQVRKADLPAIQQ